MSPVIKNLYYKIFAVLFTLSGVFHSGDYKYFVYLVSLFDPKLRFDFQLFILFKYKNLQKIDETIYNHTTPQKTGLKLVGVSEL